MEQLAVPQYSNIVKAIATGNGIYAYPSGGWRILEKKDNAIPLGAFSLFVTSIELAKYALVFVPGHEPLRYDNPLVAEGKDLAINCSGHGGLEVSMSVPDHRAGHILLCMVSDSFKNVISCSVANNEARWIVSQRLNPFPFPQS